MPRKRLAAGSDSSGSDLEWELIIAPHPVIFNGRGKGGRREEGKIMRWKGGREEEREGRRGDRRAKGKGGREERGIITRVDDNFAALTVSLVVEKSNKQNVTKVHEIIVCWRIALPTFLKQI